MLIIGFLSTNNPLEEALEEFWLSSKNEIYDILMSCESIYVIC